jgi:glycosyltransferase involved in cell wall biosynthesis
MLCGDFLMQNEEKKHGSRIAYLMQNGVAELSEISGPQLHVLAVIHGLRDIGQSVRVVAFQKDELGWSEDLKEWLAPRYGISKNKAVRLIESGIRRIQYELKLPYVGLFDSLRFADACVNQLGDFDALYERHGYMGFGGVIASRWLGIPLILELNGNIIQEIDLRPMQMSSIQRSIGRWVTIQTFKAADRVVVVSDSLKQRLINDYHLPATKITVVVNGVDLRLFSKICDPGLTRMDFGIASGPMITFVGTFEPWHGVELLISSFSEVAEKHPEAQLVLIGDGQGKARAVRQAEQYGLGGRIRFLGRLPQEEVAKVLRISKILVAPYPYQHGDIIGTPLKLMEYMATGAAIVASTAPIHEIIEHGVTGLRVPAADVKALADGINCLLENDDLCAYLGRNAEHRAQMFSWKNVVIQLNHILTQEIAHKQRSIRDEKQVLG